MLLFKKRGIIMIFYKYQITELIVVMIYLQILFGDPFTANKITAINIDWERVKSHGNLNSFGH